MNAKPDGNQMPPEHQEMPLIEHLLELRNRLLKMVLAVLVCFAAIYPFANELYLFLSEPIRSLLPVGQTMIATDVTSPFFAPLKLALVLAVFAAIPIILYQLWSFIAPGLYAHEKRLAFPLLFTSVILFYAGAAFAYFVVFPWCSASLPRSVRKASSNCRTSPAISISCSRCSSPSVWPSRFRSPPCC